MLKSPRSLGFYQFFVAALLVLACQPAFAEQRVALVIGNSAYQNVAPLANPVNDGTVIASTLKDAGFDVVDFRRDLPAAETRRVLRDFADRARDADIAVVYYAGHGIEVDGANYLIPVDARLERDTDVYDEAFSLDRVLIAVEPARKLRLVILDACRDNPFAKTMKRTVASRAIGQGLVKVEPTSPNVLIAYSAKAGSTAADGDGKNSPFTMGAQKAQQTRAEADARVAEQARIAAEKAKQVAQDQAAAAEQKRVEAEKTAADSKVAAVAPAAKPETPNLAALSAGATQTDVNKSVQAELRRVGCLSADADGNWNTASQRSLAQFNRYARTRLDTKLASTDALDTIKLKSARICPLACEHGYRVDGERCVKISCGAGSFVNDDNECQKKRVAPLRPEAKQIIVRRYRAPTSPPAATAQPLTGEQRELGCNTREAIMSGKC